MGAFRSNVRPETRLGDHIELVTGPAFQSRKFRLEPPGIRLIRGDNLAEGGFEWGDKTRYWPSMQPELERYLLHPGDVLVGMDGSKVGKKRAWVSEEILPCLLVQRVARLRASPTVDSRFLYYVVSSRAFQDHVEGIRTGTAIPHISAEQIERFTFPLPSLEEQREIVGLLGTLDDKIELNRRMAATAHELAHAIFRSRYRADDPDLPHEPLGDHLEVARGISYTGAGLADSGIPLHNLNSVRAGGGYSREGIKYYRSDHQERHLVRPGDVVVASVDLTWLYRVIASPALVPATYGDASLFSQDLFRVRPKSSSQLSLTFIYLMLLPGRLRSEVAGYANGTTVNRIPMEALQKPRFAAPPRELVEEIDALVTPLIDKIDQLEDESATLTQLRDTLLPKLISGEVRLGMVRQAT